MRRINASDMRNLERHGRRWRVTVNVPNHLRAILGCTRLKKALQTDSPSEAVRRKVAALAELYQRLAEAEEVALGAPKSMRVMAARLHEEYGETVCDGEAREREDDIRAILQPVTNKLKEVYVPEAEEFGWVIPPDARATIDEVRAIAHGKLRPIDAFEDEFLGRSLNKERTKDDLRRALKHCESACKIDPLMRGIGVQN